MPVVTPYRLDAQTQGGIGTPQWAFLTQDTGIGKCYTIHFQFYTLSFFPTVRDASAMGWLRWSATCIANSRSRLLQFQHAMSQVSTAANCAGQGGRECHASGEHAREHV